MAHIVSRIHVEDTALNFDPAETYGVEIEQDGRLFLHFDDGEVFKVDGWLADYTGTTE